MVNMLKVLVAVILLLAIISFGVLGKRLWRMLTFNTARTHSSESAWVEIATGIITAAIAILPYTNKKPEATIAMWAGVIVFFIGGIVQLTARKQLQENKTFQERLSEGFDAAQTGIYTKIRHPGKSALLLLMLGISLSLGSGWGIVLTIALFLPSVLYRISQEEKMLLDEFGERWLTYKQDTKRIMPKVF